MRIAYLSLPFYSDVDFSFIQKLNNKADVFFFLDITPYSMNTTAINIKKQYPKTGIYNADIYKELNQYEGLIKNDKTFIVNRTSIKGYNLKNIWLSIIMLIKLIKLNPDVIHCTYFFQYHEFFYYFLRKKIILTVHDPLLHSGDNTFRNRFNRKIAYKLINNFVLLNESQKEEFVAINNFQKKNIFLSRLGVYTYLNLFLNQQITTKKKYILFFGRISPYKGIEYLLNAMKQVHCIYPEIELIIAGSGYFYFDITEYKNYDFIEFRNRYIPENELASLIKNSQFVVCPYTDATQSGVVMSAFTFCKPVIATNVGGLSEYIDNNVTGILIEPKSEIALFEAIKSLLENEITIKKLEANIKAQYYEERNSWNEITKNMIKIYSTLLK